MAVLKRRKLRARCPIVYTQNSWMRMIYDFVFDSYLQHWPWSCKEKERSDYLSSYVCFQKGQIRLFYGMHNFKKILALFQHSFSPILESSTPELDFYPQTRAQMPVFGGNLYMQMWGLRISPKNPLTWQARKQSEVIKNILLTRFSVFFVWA